MRVREGVPITHPLHFSLSEKTMRKLTESQKEASSARAKAWREKQLKENPKEFRKYNANRAKKLYHSNPKISENQQRNFKASYDSNPEFRSKVVRSASTGRYKMTPAQFDEQLQTQGGHCALCESTDGDAGRRLHIDHDHACCDGKARTCGNCNRGILCGPCNRRLGALEAVLKEATVVPKVGTWTARAIAYLKSYEKTWNFNRLAEGYLALAMAAPGNGIRITNIQEPSAL